MPLSVARRGTRGAELRSAIQQFLIDAWCDLTPVQVDNLLLWIDDVQDLVDTHWHPQLCALWNRFWVELWAFRAECPHPSWITKDYLRHPNHYTCSVCGLVGVVSSLTAVPSDGSHVPSAPAAAFADHTPSSPIAGPAERAGDSSIDSDSA